MNQAPDLLEAIVAATSRRVADLRAVRPLHRVEREAGARVPDAAGFTAALSRSDAVNIIAECKRRSPSRGVLQRVYDPVATARTYAAAGAAAVSVLTEPAFFDGALDHLRAVRAAVSLPLLRKDFVIDEYQLLEARAAGADAVLLIVARAAEDLGLAVLVEIHDDTELARALSCGARIVGVNNRNLRTLSVDVRASERLAPALPASVVAVSESGLGTAGEVARLRAAGYQAFLVGEHLMTSEAPAEVLTALLTSPAPHETRR